MRKNNEDGLSLFNPYEYEKKLASLNEEERVGYMKAMNDIFNDIFLVSNKPFQEGYYVYSPQVTHTRINKYIHGFRLFLANSNTVGNRHDFVEISHCNTKLEP